MYYICSMHKNFFELTDYNKPVYETSNFVVIPTLGALIEGWLLIVPKNFYLNFSHLPYTQFAELTNIIDHLENRFRCLFEGAGTVIFEHGPSETKSNAGCGVDYAHLHWVPTDFDLKKGVSEFLSLTLDWKPIKSLADIKAKGATNQDYLYLRDQAGENFLACQDEVPSQTFRKVIAHYLNQPEGFDWKANFGFENIQSAYSKLNLQL
jgi:ATP adenylyltransferase